MTQGRYLMAGYKIISSDSHIIEPPDLWTARVEGRFKEKAPRVVSEENGDWWYIDGHRTNSFQSGAFAGVRFENPEDLRMSAKWENVRPGGFMIDDRIKDLDADGVDGEVIYPTEGLLAYNTGDPELLTVICATYNEAMSEFCSPAPDRLKGIAMINVDDVESAVKEMHRSRQLGLVGAMITVYPTEDKSYDRPEYEPFWEAAEELRMPLSLHVATGRPGPGQEFQDPTNVRPAFFATADYWVRVSLAHMIFSGVFERHPRLKVISVEHEVAWAPFFIELLDYTYTQRAHRGPGWRRFKPGVLPSHFFRSNILISFQEDGRGINDRAAIGVDNLMWGSDYPHTESTFPRSRQILDEILAGVPEDEKAKIVGGNAARLYNFN